MVHTKFDWREFNRRTIDTGAGRINRPNNKWLSTQEVARGEAFMSHICTKGQGEETVLIKASEPIAVRERPPNRGCGHWLRNVATAKNCSHQHKYPDYSLLLLSGFLLVHLLSTSIIQSSRKPKWCSSWKSGSRVQAGRVDQKYVREDKWKITSIKHFCTDVRSPFGKFPRTGVVVSIGR